jgi:hypothetical protein
MANNQKNLTQAYDELPMLLRLIIVVIGGALVGGIYRLVKWYEKRNTVTLVVGLVTTITGIGNLIIWVVDVVTTAMGRGIYVLAD